MQRGRLTVYGVHFVRIEEERTKKKKKSTSSWLTRSVPFSCLSISGYILFFITLISQIFMFVRLCLFSFSSLLKPFCLMLLIFLVMIRIAPCLGFIFTGWQLSLGGVCFIQISVFFLLLQQFFFLNGRKKNPWAKGDLKCRRNIVFSVQTEGSNTCMCTLKCKKSAPGIRKKESPWVRAVLWPFESIMSGWPRRLISNGLVPSCSLSQC